MADQPLAVFTEGMRTFTNEQHTMKQSNTNARSGDSLNLLTTRRTPLDAIHQIPYKNTRNDVIFGAPSGPVFRAVHELAPRPHQNALKSTVVFPSHKADESSAHYRPGYSFISSQQQMNNKPVAVGPLVSYSPLHEVLLSPEHVPLLKEDFVDYSRSFLCSKGFHVSDIVSKMRDIVSLEFCERNEMRNKEASDSGTGTTGRHITVDITNFNPETGRFEVQFTSTTFGQAATIFVSIYKMWSSDNTYVVECNRGSGDYQTYHEFLNEFTFLCHEKKLVKYTDIPFDLNNNDNDNDKTTSTPSPFVSTFGSIPDLSV